MTTSYNGLNDYCPLVIIKLSTKYYENLIKFISGEGIIIYCHHKDCENYDYDKEGFLDSTDFYFCGWCSFKGDWDCSNKKHISCYANKSYCSQHYGQYLKKDNKNDYVCKDNKNCLNKN